MEVCFLTEGCVMNQAEHFDMDRDDALRELGVQTLASRIALQRRMSKNSPLIHPDARMPDEPECDAYGLVRKPWGKK